MAKPRSVHAKGLPRNVKRKVDSYLDQDASSFDDDNQQGDDGFVVPHTESLDTPKPKRGLSKRVVCRR